MVAYILEYSAIIGTLVLMEGLLAADNALVLAVLVSRLPDRNERKKALLYGIIGAFVFRALSLVSAYWLIRMWEFKALGAAYLIFMTARYFWSGEYRTDRHAEPRPFPAAKETEREGGEPAGARARFSRRFWPTVAMVELTDLAFSVDQIVAAVGLSSHLAVVYTGGMIGIIAMRFAAGGFLLLIERHPKLAYTGHILPAWIGLKLAMETLSNHPFDWHVKMPAWVYWSGMAALVAWGLLSRGRTDAASHEIQTK